MHCEEFERILESNVVSIIFRKQDGSMRNMLCTRSKLLLDSYEGNVYLKYQHPRGYPSYDPKAHNNVIVWDIQREDFRQVKCDTIRILKQVKDEIYLDAVRKNPLLGWDSN